MLLAVLNSLPPVAMHCTVYVGLHCIGESDVWRFALKMQSVRFLIGGFDTVLKETHA